MPQADGTYLIEGGMMVRDLNKRLGWELPTEGPKTLSGLILEESFSFKTQSSIDDPGDQLLLLKIWDNFEF